MPFNREYRRANGEEPGYYINRDRTGPPGPPQPGVVQTNAGVVTGADTNVVGGSNVVLQPDKDIPVTIPGPREKVIDAHGNMSPRWRRFFEELYRRTGGALEDTVNAASFTFSNPELAPDDLVITGAAPTLAYSWVVFPSTQSVSLTGQQPTVS